MQGVQAAQGSVSPEALAKAATVDPTQTLVGGLQAAQGQATQVQAPAPLQMTADQTVSGLLLISHRYNKFLVVNQ